MSLVQGGSELVQSGVIGGALRQTSLGLQRLANEQDPIRRKSRHLHEVLR